MNIIISRLNQVNLVVITLLFSCFLYAQESVTNLKSISGKITYLEAPLPDVNITIDGTTKGTKTDAQGSYNIEANIGDVILYTHVGFNTVSIMVEEVTEVLNINMDAHVANLDEVVLTARKKVEKVADLHEVLNVDLKTSLGTINPSKSNYPVHYLGNRELSRLAGPTLENVLNRFSNVRKIGETLYIRKVPARYDIDGILYRQAPVIAFSNIEHIFIMKDKALVIIRTKNAPEEIKKRQEAKTEQYRNQNYYKEDALPSANETTFSSANATSIKNNHSITKDIKGKITYLDAPLADVNIVIKETSRGTKTDNKGNYSIEAKVGEVIVISHVGFTKVSIIVEDITEVLNIEMAMKENVLETVIVNAIKTSNQNTSRNSDVIQTAEGKENPMRHEKVRYFDRSRIQTQYRTLSDALKLYYPKGLPGKIFDVDGVIFRGEPLIRLSTITSIYVIEKRKSFRFNEPSIIIRTTNSPEYKERIAEQNRNQNYYNEDAIDANNVITFSLTNAYAEKNRIAISKDINGTVSYLETPLTNVNIIVVGKSIGTKTNIRGVYTIKAEVGDIIQYSHLGFATVSVIVEDVTEVLDIEMVLRENELEEVIVTADGKLGKTAELAKKSKKKFSTAMGTFDPKTSGNAIAYIDGDDANPGARDILDVLNGKVAGVTVNRLTNEVKIRDTGSITNDVPPIWDVDGLIINTIPQVSPDNIKEIHVLKSLASTARYGTSARGGVIVVTTKSGDFSTVESNRNKIAEQYTNKDYYANDASQISLESLNSNAYSDVLEAFSSKQKAYIYYDEKLKNQITSYVDHLAIAQKFVSHFKDFTLATQIFKNLLEQHGNNPEILKAVAFHLQTIGKNREAVDAYKRTFKLRPKYAQSYRDLANAYMENDQYKKAWRLYMRHLMQGNDVSGEGIGELIYNEMEYLYFNRKNQTNIKEQFLPLSENLAEFRNDVRLVFEWNTSEAEFDIEFVNPELRSYVFEHTLAANQELITDEKLKGYSSKSFFIDDLSEGEWLVNLTYRGNKKPEPTYFKLTTYYNWGKPGQRQETSVYKLENQRYKIQLMKFYQEMLLVSN